MPEPNTRVRVVRGEFRYDREHYTAGDELDVHEGALDSHPRTLERVEGAADEPLPEPEDLTVDHGDGVTVETELSTDDLDPHPTDLTVEELEDRIAEVEDTALLETIRQAEAEQDDPRSTALDAIDDRLDDLEA